MGNFDDYNTKVGHAQGGDTAFVKNGGNIVVESGGSIDLENGADVDIKAGATMTVAATGAIDVAETGIMGFFGQDFTGAELRLVLLSQMTATEYVLTASSLSVSVFLPIYGYALLTADTGASKTSIKLPSAEKGAMLTLNFGGYAGDANASVFAASGGGNASLTGLTGVDLSSFEVSAVGFIKLMCETAGLWQVIEQNASVTERAA